MYTRSYFTEDKKIDIPENYDGNAFRENKSDFDVRREHDIEVSDDCPVNDDTTDSTESSSRNAFSSLLEKLPVKNLFSGFPFSFFKNGSGREERRYFGTEEILIFIIAAYMFLSKDGDRECAIMLALLLFIG